MKKPVVNLIFMLLVLLLVSIGCSFSDRILGVDTPTHTLAATTPVPSATSTNTPLTPTATITLYATHTSLPASSSPDSVITTGTPEAPSTGVALPVTFNIVLNAPATVCGEGVSSEFTVTLTETSITMYQIEFQLTSTGPYNPASGAFTSTVSGLPGTETFTGMVAFTPGSSGTMVSMNGEFTYTGDPDWNCSVPDVFSGQATINP